MSRRARSSRAVLLMLLAIFLFGSVAHGAVFPPVPGDPPEPPGEDPRFPQPDIVVLVLDDIPPLDGRLWRKLPNIKRFFVDQATEFTDAHGETPTCCPGRAGFLTGLHTHHHGTYKTDGSLFKPGETIATELRKSGYHTIQVGKYLNLFERVFPKLPPGWSDFHGFGGAYYDYNMYSNGVPTWHGRETKDYSTDVISRLAARSIRKAPRRKPLFAWLTPYSMHKPWLVAPRHKKSKRCRIRRWKPKNYMERNARDKPAYVRRRRIRQRAGYDLTRTCKGLLSVDQMLGRVVRELRKRGTIDNTMLVLTSDNGMTFGAHRIYEDKKSPYASQIPLFVRWPRLLGKEPRKVSERVQNIDLAPTLCDIARCRMGPYPTGQRDPDGVSILDLITGDSDQLSRQAVLTSYQDPDHRVPTYWSITTTGSSPLAGRRCGLKREGGCRWVYTEYGTGERELYDISNGPCWQWDERQGGDPCMLKNKAGKKRFAGVEQQLRRQLRRLHNGGSVARRG